MDVLKDEYLKCRGGGRGKFTSPDSMSKYHELQENVLDKWVELITPCSHRWPPENEEENQALYMAVHAFSPELIIKEFRIWIAEVERDVKRCIDNVIVQICEWFNAYGKLPLDPVDSQKFMLKDEPWIAERVASELQDLYTALCEYKAALYEYGEWWNSISASGILKTTALNVIKNPITGIIDAVGNGLAAVLDEDTYSQEKRKLIAKGSAAQELCGSYVDKLCNAVFETYTTRVFNDDYMTKIANEINEEFERLNNLIDSGTQPLHIADTSSTSVVPSAPPVTALPASPAAANRVIDVTAVTAPDNTAQVITEATASVVTVTNSVTDEEEIDYVEIARDITEAMTIAEIRTFLEEHGLDSSGAKKNLIGRLARALEDGKIKVK